MERKYQALFEHVENSEIDAVFLGGDLLSASGTQTNPVMTLDEIIESICRSSEENGVHYFAIMGNDDLRSEEGQLKQADEDGILDYVNMKKRKWLDFTVAGYSFVPPTPFLLKDWEKYDVSRFVDPGSVSPEMGYRTVEMDPYKVKNGTIKNDLEMLGQGLDFSRTIMLFHSPPYNTNLDRADLDGKMVDHAPLDVHVGSIAIEKFIRKNQPAVTLHGHIHESTNLTGKWSEQLGRTWAFNGACLKNEMAVVVFDAQDPGSAQRVLLY